MSLPLVLWIYFTFGLVMFFAVVAFIARLFIELEKQNLKDQQEKADRAFYHHKQKKS